MSLKALISNFNGYRFEQQVLVNGFLQNILAERIQRLKDNCGVCGVFFKSGFVANTFDAHRSSTSLRSMPFAIRCICKPIYPKHRR